MFKFNRINYMYGSCIRGCETCSKSQKVSSSTEGYYSLWNGKKSSLNSTSKRLKFMLLFPLKTSIIKWIIEQNWHIAR